MTATMPPITMPQDKTEIMICVTAHGYTATHVPRKPYPSKLCSVFFPTIDALLDWLADNLAVPTDTKTNNPAPLTTGA